MRQVAVWALAAVLALAGGCRKKGNEHELYGLFGLKFGERVTEAMGRKVGDDPRGTAEIWEVTAPEPMRHLTKYTAYVRKGDRRIWGLKGEAECANYLEARAKLFEVKTDLEIMMRYHMDSRTSPDHFAVRFANATSPSRGTLALRAEPGPPTARVTLFALDEANLPK